MQNLFQSTSKIEISNEILLKEVSELLNEGKEVVLLAKGSSMLPFIRDCKDSVRLKKRSSFGIGDIVLAKIAAGRWVLHRIIGIDGESVTLMGDGNISGIEQCLKKDIAGRVEAIVRPDGKEIVPGKAGLWRKLLPVRRYILGVYRRIVK